MLDQRAQDGLDLRGRLALAEDHFGKSAPDATVQVHLGEAAGIDVGLGLDPQRGIGHRQLAGRDGRRASCCQLMRVHEPRYPLSELGPAIERRLRSPRFPL